jgi:hypothetical protein
MGTDVPQEMIGTSGENETWVVFKGKNEDSGILKQ